MAKMVCSLSSPRFLNNDSVTAKIIYSPGHACQEVLAEHGLCLVHIFMSSTQKKWQHISACLMALSVESAMRGDNIVCLLMWLLHSQERLNVSAVPRAPQVFSQPLSWHLAYTGFSKQCKQCEQQDNWCHKQDQ